MNISRSINLAVNHAPISNLNTTRKRLNNIKTSPKGSMKIVDDTKATKLKQLSSRVRNHRNSEVPPEIAAKVVKNYILPMFESEARSKHDTQRSETYGHRRNFSLEQGTVYSELKLSKQIMSLESKLSSMSQSIKDSVQEKQTLLILNQKLELDLMNSSTNLMFLNDENSRLKRELIGFKLSTTAVINQLNKYKVLYEQLTSEKSILTAELHQERANNDIRLNFL
jgi:hypothetical protein